MQLEHVLIGLLQVDYSMPVRLKGERILHKHECLYTVSHFSYAPFFQGPYFLTKKLESNILYDNLLIDILSVC